MMPQAAAPPISRMATSGPSTWNAPSEMFEIEKVRMQATTHERDTTSCQPSASSDTKARRRAGSTAGMRIATRKAALTRKLAPSMAKAQPAPMVATIRPDSSGPKMWVALCEMLISALASCSRFAPTICGIRPIEAGMKNAAALPITTAKAISCQISALPVISRVAITACAPARTRSQATITCCRGRRSDQTPPANVNRTRGNAKAAKTRPRSAADPVSSSTAKASATPTSASPRYEPVCPIHSRRKSRSESAAVELRQKARNRSMALRA